MIVRFLFCGLLLLAASLQPTLAAPDYGKVVSQSYDKTQMVTETHLANGLTILSKESHAAPVVYFSVWYKVGSRDEVSGRTGLSHILEHMMFKGTHDLPPGAIDHLFLTNGGDINAETGSDYTHYFELIASDRLELSMRVEADRMENSLFDPTQLAHEMVVVRSELEGDSNDPGFQLYNFNFLPTAFTAHPYHWPTIGWISDVEDVAKKRDVIYQYYKDHYMPNNAVVVMVGDFDTKKAVSLCQKYFGVYPAGKLAAHHITPEPPQRGERRAVLQRPGTTGQVLIGYHEPGLGTKAHYVMDVIGQILSGGRSARLYQSLVETGIAQAAGAGGQDMKDPYLFVFGGTPRTGVTDEALEKGLEDQETVLQTTPVTKDELDRAYNQIAAAFIFQNDSVSQQADQIGEYACIGSYRYIDDYLAKIRQVTPADIQQVAKEYFIPDNRTVAYFEPQPLPPGQAPPPPPVTDNFGAAPPVTDPHQKAVLAALDKTFNNAMVTPSADKRPKPTQVTLPNGLTVIVEENHANHTVALEGLTHAGSMYDPDGKWGLAALTAAMLPRGTATKDALQLALSLESVGANVGVSADMEFTSFSGACLAQNFDLTLGTMADEVLHPVFPTDQLEKLQGETLAGLEEARQDTGGTGGAGALADIAFSQTLFPKGNPFWTPSIDQSEDALKSLGQSDLQSFYQTYYRPDTTTLVIVGDVTTADVLKAVQADFGGWSKPATVAPAYQFADTPLPAHAPAPQVIALPDTSQTNILWGYPGQLKRSDSDFYAVTIMNYILGGDIFGSRLGRVIRDENGLAYTVSSDFVASHGAGPFEVFVGTNPANAGHAISLLETITSQMKKNGVTADEVRQAKEYLTGSYPLRLETNAGVAEQLLVAQDYGLGLDYIQKRASYYNQVSVTQVDAAVKKYLHPDKAALIISGAAPGK